MTSPGVCRHFGRSEKYTSKDDIRTVPVFVCAGDLYLWRACFQDLTIAQIDNDMSGVGDQVTALQLIASDILQMSS